MLFRIKCWCWWGGSFLCSGSSPYWKSCCLPEQEFKRKIRRGKKAVSRGTKGEEDGADIEGGIKNVYTLY
jgi:hypothetical protein